MAKRSNKQRVFKAVSLKASTIRRLIRTGRTIGQIADTYGVTRMTLYRRYGSEFKGMSKPGRRG